MSTSEYRAPRLDHPPLSRWHALMARVTTPVSADVWAVAGLVTVAAVVRILTIDNQSFWTDEALTAFEAHLPFGDMIHTVQHVETTPPLYFVLDLVLGQAIRHERGRAAVDLDPGRDRAGADRVT